MGIVEAAAALGARASGHDVRFTGVCSGCPSAAFTLQFGVEMALREAIPGFEAVHLV